MGAFGSPDTFPYDKMEKKCPKCGKIVEGKFCPECGTRIEGNKKKKSGCLLIFIICLFLIFGFIALTMYGRSLTTSNVVNSSQYTNVNIGDTVSSGDTEYTLMNASLTDEIVADWTEIKQVHKASGSNTIVQLDIDIKNMGTQNITCGKGLVGQAFYDNGQYKYSGAWVIKDASKGFITSDSEEILPLETKSIIMAIEIPEEVQNGDKDLYVIFGPKEKPLMYKIK